MKDKRSDDYIDDGDNQWNHDENNKQSCIY